MKKKILFISSVIILLLITLIIYFYNKNEKNLYENNFYEQVNIIKETKLYDKNQNSIGIIHPNTVINLEKKQDKKYKIKNYEYFIDYHNLKKIETNINNELLVFNQNIITNDKFNLYQNNEIKIEIYLSMEFPIYQISDSTYTISFLNQYYEIKKEDVKEIKENINSNEEYATYIPVLYFVNIVNDHYYNESLREDKYKEIINYLNSQNLNYIDINTYNLWIKGYINLPKNSVLLMSEKENIENNIYQKTEDIIINNEVSIIDKKRAYKINNLINIADIKEILKGNKLINVKIDDSKLATSIPVLNYHFFYADGEVCNEIICLHTNKLEEQFKYLNENGYKTLTMREYIDWYNGKIELPEKSVLLTIDDGAMGTDTHLPRLLDEYQIHATLFLITAWWPKEKYNSNYLDIESHGHDIHIYGNCGKERLLCLNLEEKIQDFQKSINLLGTSQAFCYPFYEYDNLSFDALKQAGFEVAFWGGGYKSTRKSNRYLIPRYPIYSNMTLNQFISIIK